MTSARTRWRTSSSTWPSSTRRTSRTSSCSLLLITMFLHLLSTASSSLTDARQLPRERRSQGSDDVVLTSGSSRLVSSSSRQWEWCVLTLSGNASVAAARPEDFVRYLRINVASLIGADFEGVQYNGLNYSPLLLVNLTLDFTNRSRRIIKVLESLAEHNDTLLDLSGSPFRLVHFLPRSAIMRPKPAVADDRQMETLKLVENVVWGAVIAALVVLALASLVFAVINCRRDNEEDGQIDKLQDEDVVDNFNDASNVCSESRFSNGFALNGFDDSRRRRRRLSDECCSVDEAMARSHTIETELDVVATVDRPFSVQGHQSMSRQPYFHKRHSRGGYLPMAPIFDHNLNTFRPVVVHPPPMPTEAEIARDVEIVLHNLGIEQARVNGIAEEQCNHL